MEFWGVEVKAGKPLKVSPEPGKLIHMSQAALGEVKDVKSAKNVPLKLKINSQDFVIGSLSAEERPQIMFDLVFEKDFEISHDWKNGSVYFVGYSADEPLEENDMDFSDDSEDESEDEPLPVVAKVNDKPTKAKVEDVKPAAKPAVAAKAEVAKVADEDEDDEDSDDSDSDDEMASLGVDSDDSDESLSSDEEEEELPKVQQPKKRANESAQKTPVPAKKAKAATPDNTGNKKPHTATPFPSKGNKSNGQSPKSGGFNKNQSPKSGGGFNKSGGGGRNSNFKGGKRGGKN